MGKAFFTVFYDTPHGYDWDESFDILVRAYRFYMKVDAPFKKLVMTDREHGDRTILSSKGEDNIDALGLRHLIW